MLYLINNEYTKIKYKNKKFVKNKDFNKTINKFINNDRVLAVFIINCIHRFFN